MTVEQFVDDDQKYLKWIANHPDGFVVNATRGVHTKSARLHASGCRTISGTSPRGGPWTGPYMKVCSDTQSPLEHWYREKTGEAITRCKVCLPGGDAPPKVRKPAAPAQASLDFELEADAQLRRVDVWTERRLQFNSKPETVALKSAIGAAVSKLEARPGEILSAVFTSASVDLVDAENVLFYNVGTSRFATSTREGLRFERDHGAPSRQRHHHRYELTARDSVSQHWRRDQTAIAFSGSIPAINEMSKPDPVWLAVRRQATRAKRCEGLYGLLVTLTTPRPVRLAALLKPLLDGLISGIHAHDGTDLSLLSSRLALRLGLPADEVAQLLMEPQQAVLGVRPVLRKFGDGLQWNPADDECVTCTLWNSVVPQATNWSLDFELFGVTPLKR